jgi:5-dehydro-4-deoxyglucarate dehydratase
VTEFTPASLAAQIGSGLLSFPVTHFSDDLDFDEHSYREHLAWLSQFPVAGLFAAGGTGEFFSLTAPEIERVVTAAVDEVGGRVPVLAPAGLGIRAGIEMAQAAERAGAAGILLFPHYLTEASQDGIAAFVETICASTSLGVVLYNRANGRIEVPTLERLAGRCPNLVGFKDGIGDIELMAKIYARLGDRFTYVGGLPTAETFALPYLELGVTTYSSALFNFLPEFALEFYGDVRARRRDAVYDKLDEFVLPYLEIRDRHKGYAVSIIKAGLDAVGRRGGPVRPPLQPLSELDFADLSALTSSIPLQRAS